MKNIALYFLGILLIFAGCDLYEQNGYQEYYVVESYLVANDTLPQVRLSTTAPITEEYNFREQAITGANVEIHLLNTDSSIAEVYPYQQNTPGIYISTVPANVQDERLYKLQVTLANGDVITSITYVPRDFKTVNELQDSYIYQSQQQVEITATPSAYITGRQTYYIFTLNAVNPDISKLTPFYFYLIDDQDNDIRSYYINSSGIINEGNYKRNSDGNILLKVPWLAFAFYDTNDVVANAIDNNMYDFLRSQDVQTGGIALSPGEIQNIRYNVKGGIGIFGSLASDTNRVMITKPQN